MIATHRIKSNGVWYNCGDEVPEVEDAISGTDVATHTKTEINRMSTDDLKALAISEGIDNAENMTGGALKEVLIAHFAL